MRDGINIIERVHARGAFLKVLDNRHLDLATRLGRGFSPGAHVGRAAALRRTGRENDHG